jgi:hypothetical protein
MSNRRQFLSTLGKALGAGGLLLPLQGKGAVALAADLGEAARLPVSVAPLPFSKQALHLREINRALHRCHLANHSEARQREWRSLMVDEYGPTAHAIAGREKPTWSDCVELAEIIWRGLPKETRVADDAPPDWQYEVETGALCMSDETRMHSDQFRSGCHWSRAAIIALVEAVLILGKGERFDPGTPQGFYPDYVRSKGFAEGA